MDDDDDGPVEVFGNTVLARFELGDIGGVDDAALLSLLLLLATIRMALPDEPEPERETAPTVGESYVDGVDVDGSVEAARTLRCVEAGRCPFEVELELGGVCTGAAAPAAAPRMNCDDEDGDDDLPGVVIAAEFDVDVDDEYPRTRALTLDETPDGVVVTPGDALLLLKMLAFPLPFPVPLLEEDGVFGPPPPLLLTLLPLLLLPVTTTLRLAAIAAPSCCCSVLLLSATMAMEHGGLLAAGCC